MYDIAAIEQIILLLRGQKVILDRDLAALYGVPTKSMNRAVKRNLDRFPADFMFQLTLEEAVASRCQIGTLKRGHNIKYLPYAFTEHGAIMAATVLNSRPNLASPIGSGIVTVGEECTSRFVDNDALDGLGWVWEDSHDE